MQTDYVKLIDYYRSSDSEQGRLQLDQAHMIEFLTTMHYLKKHLPEGCTVLDCCAGGGAYAFPLARAGYRVTAGDLVQAHVNMLSAGNRDGALECVYQGNVLDMSRFANETFDAVLCMGALYHLMDGDDRVQCVAECLRVLKNGGVFAYAYINRNAVFINHFSRGVSTVDARDNVLRTGVNGIFYGMGFHEPEELARQFGLVKIAHVGVDGLAYPLYARINEASPEEFAAYMDYHLESCEQPSIIGHSMHGLWIGRKRKE